MRVCIYEKIGRCRSVLSDARKRDAVGRRWPILRVRSHQLAESTNNVLDYWIHCTVYWHFSISSSPSTVRYFLTFPTAVKHIRSLLQASLATQKPRPPSPGQNFAQHVDSTSWYRDLEPWRWRVLRIVSFFLQTISIASSSLYHCRWGLCILCVLLIGALISSYYLQVKRIRAVHETVISIFAGMVVGLIIRLAPGHMIRDMMVC